MHIDLEVLHTYLPVPPYLIVHAGSLRLPLSSTTTFLTRPETSYIHPTPPRIPHAQRKEHDIFLHQPLPPLLVAHSCYVLRDPSDAFFVQLRVFFRFHTTLVQARQFGSVEEARNGSA
jgi:hypothetical protein